MINRGAPIDELVRYNDTLLDLYGEAYAAIISGEPQFALQTRELRAGPAELVVRAAFEHAQSSLVLDPIMPDLIRMSTSGCMQPMRREGRLVRESPNYLHTESNQ
jgi:hypothetical protein